MLQTTDAQEFCTVLEPGDVDWIGVLRLHDRWRAVSVRFRTVEHSVTASMDIPEDGIYDRPLTHVSFRSCQVSLQLQIPETTLQFKGKFRDGALAGTVASSLEADRQGVFYLVQAASDTPNPFQQFAGRYGISPGMSVLIGVFEDHLVYVQLPDGRAEEIRLHDDGSFMSPSGAMVSFTSSRIHS